MLSGVIYSRRVRVLSQNMSAHLWSFGGGKWVVSGSLSRLLTTHFLHVSVRAIKKVNRVLRTCWIFRIVFHFDILCRTCSIYAVRSLPSNYITGKKTTKLDYSARLVSPKSLEITRLHCGCSLSPLEETWPPLSSESFRSKFARP